MRASQIVPALAAGAFLLACASALPAGEPAKASPPRLSGPYTHENLTIFLIHGEDRLKGKHFLTLEEALEQKKAIVHETQNVNQLSIENVAPDVEVFIQAGDIVKGGQQDRTIMTDLIVPPKSGKMPLAAFCVEHGRWRQRGGENVKGFSGSTDQLSSKQLKIAVRDAKQQQEVWKQVEGAQGKLQKNVGAAKSPVSESSLQLTLEHKKVTEAIEAYQKKLAGSVEGQGDVIGMAFAINGKPNSADVYASHELFLKLWPKLLKAATVEAVAEMQKDKQFDPVAKETMTAFMADAEKGKTSEEHVTKRIRTLKQETEKNLLFETRDEAEPSAAPLRKSYIAK